MADLPPYFEALMRFYTHQPRQHGHGRAFSPGAAVVYPNLKGRWHRSFSSVPGDEREGPQQEMTLEHFKEILEEIPRRCLIQFSGGFPFETRWTRRAVSMAARRRRVSLLMSGSGMEPDDAAFFLARGAPSFVEPGLWEIGVTFFGEEHAHDELVGRPGTYAASVEELAEIRRLKTAQGRRYPLVNLRFVLSPESIGGLLPAWRVAGDLRADQFSIVLEDRGPWFEPSSEKGVSVMDARPPRFPRGFARSAASQVKLILSEATAKRGPQVRITQGVDSAAEVRAYFANERDESKYECPLPWYWVLVDPSGDVYICPRYKVGNVHEEGLQDVWNGGRARAFRKALRLRGSFPACAGCPGLRLKKTPREKAA